MENNSKTKMGRYELKKQHDLSIRKKILMKISLPPPFFPQIGHYILGMFWPFSYPPSLSYND